MLLFGVIVLMCRHISYHTESILPLTVSTSSELDSGWIEAYYRNIGKQNVEAIESNPLAQALEKFVYSWYKEGGEACWQCPTSKALEQLNKVARTYGIYTTNKFWPKASNSSI